MSTYKQTAALTGPLVWTGQDFEDKRHVLQLSEKDIHEIDAAVDNFEALGLDVDRIDQDNFDLPTVGTILHGVSLAVHQGQGFVVIHGLDTSKYSAKSRTVLFLGIASYVGGKRGMQDRKGNMLAHITESKAWTVPRELRHGIHSNIELPFHSDMGSDIHALQVCNSAHDGGQTCLSSAWTVFNDLMQREPDVVETLLKPNWPIQISDSESGYYLGPLFAFYNGRLLASLDPARVGPHPGMGKPNMPALTSDQKRALAAVSESATRSEVQFKLETGDILFFNNWALLHRREAYEDDENTSRHLVRLWLRNQTLGWAIPESMLPPWQEAYGEGTVTANRQYPLVPNKSYSKPKYTTGSAAWVPKDINE